VMRAGLIFAALLAASSAAAQLPGSPAVVRPHAFSSTPVTDITPGSTVYLSIDGADLSTTQSKVAQRLNATVLRRARVTLPTAPGAGETVTLTAQTGTCGTALADSTLVVTVSGTSTTADDLTHSITVPDGNCAVWKATYSAGAAASAPHAHVAAF